MTTLYSEQHEDRVDGPDRLPPGQRLTEQWPVLTYGATPQVERGDFSLRIWGEVEEEVEFDWEQFLALGVGGTHERHPLRDALVALRQPLGGRAD